MPKKKHPVVEQSVQWRNRIISSGVKAASQFTANPDNPRMHPKSQREAVRASLDTLGWIQSVIELQDGTLLDGHERIWQALEQGEETPVPYIVVDLNEEEAKQALLTYDFIGSMAEFDRETTARLMEQVKTDDERLKGLLEEQRERLLSVSENPYSRKIESPVYEPVRDKPSVQSLYDDHKTKTLIQAIDSQEGLTDEERTFLKIAAQRHTVLNFTKIADYYAYSPEPVQRLMEDSALVIIDYNRAIELGFVKLTQRIADLYSEEYG